MTRPTPLIFSPVEHLSLTRVLKPTVALNLKTSDLADIKQNFSFFLEYITPRISQRASVRYNNEFDNYTTRGVGTRPSICRKTMIMKGRYINELDVKNKSKHAVIGRLVAQDLFKQEDPIGKFIDIGNSVFKVVGVFQDDGGDNEERFIYIPYTTRQSLKKGMTR